MAGERAMFCCQNSNPLLTLFMSSQHSTKQEPQRRYRRVLPSYLAGSGTCATGAKPPELEKPPRPRDDVEGFLCNKQTTTELRLACFSATLDPTRSSGHDCGPGGLVDLINSLRRL